MTDKNKKFSYKILREFQLGNRIFTMEQIPSLLQMYSESTIYPFVRKLHMQAWPYCQACHNNVYDQLEVHHIVPIKIDKSKYLDLNNLLTLCGDLTLFKCHLRIGHLGNYAKKFNLNAKQDADFFLTYLSTWSKK